MLPLQFPDPDITALSDSIPTRAEEMSVLSNLTFDELVQKVVHSLVTFAINLAIAIVVHVFDKNQRQFYNLEGLWADANPVDISGLLIKE